MALQMTDMRKGVCFEEEGKLYKVTEYAHVKPGKGAAFVRIKIKDIITGAVTERTIRGSDSFNAVRLETNDVQYLYNDGVNYHFMNTENYDQIALDEEMVGDAKNYMRENDMVQMETVNGAPIGVIVPASVVLTVVQTEPAVRGNTATNVTKTAVMDTGCEIQVPIFIDEGEQIKVDTRTGAYMSRA